uniref:4-alpha-glucanotransferase n=1 Tax=uncultured Burkholderia sp. TaxID=188058 RepID=A0A060BTY9_9BURK|nr:Glyco_hydro_77 [uncultured Burkholderia sp.]
MGHHDLLTSRAADFGLRGLSGDAQRRVPHGGGIRIDHILGLRRLWLVPHGASPRDGAYLRYPMEDMLRLVKLESWRHNSIVIGEDLGTVPAGFRPKLDRAGLAGMRCCGSSAAAQARFRGSLHQASWVPAALR